MMGWASGLTKLEGDQLRELGRDVCHRLFCSAQATSRAEQGTDFAESFIRRAVHDGNEQITRQERRKLLVGNAFTFEAAQQRRGYQHDPDSRLRQSLIDFAEQSRTEEDDKGLAKSRVGIVPIPYRFRGAKSHRGGRPSR